jgi:hypothetical protein
MPLNAAPLASGHRPMRPNLCRQNGRGETAMHSRAHFDSTGFRSLLSLSLVARGGCPLRRAELAKIPNCQHAVTDRSSRPLLDGRW